MHTHITHFSVYRTTPQRWVSTRPTRPSGRPSRCGRASRRSVSGKSPTVTYGTRLRSLQTLCYSLLRVSMVTAVRLMARGASWPMPTSPVTASVGTPTLMQLSRGLLEIRIWQVRFCWICWNWHFDEWGDFFFFGWNLMTQMLGGPWFVGSKEFC